MVGKGRSGFSYMVLGVRQKTWVLHQKFMPVFLILLCASALLERQLINSALSDGLSAFTQRQPPLNMNDA